ncbi:flagellin, partial [uncultured Oscillibacter sp.]|uniref:flagellin n=1 Tax=uncultured Oscillibacter sp. TaxID=876091 RepID=UPI0025CBF10A
MRIQHNILAMNSYRNYTNNVNALGKNLEKLSSGYKINRAGDDAAGLAISEKMRSQITGLQAAQKNVKDATNLVKTAEGAMQEVQDMLKRMKYLATQSANGTYDENVDRVQLQKEVNSLLNEIDRIADSANFNGIKLLDGTQSQISGVTFTQATTGAKAKFQINFSGTGKDYIGGSIQIGSKTYNVVQATGTNAAKTYCQFSGDKLVVGLKATATKIASAVAAKMGANMKLTTLDGKTDTATVNKTGAGIKIEGSASGVMIDASSLPTYSANGGIKLQIGDTPHTYNQIRAGANDIHVSKLFAGNLPNIATQSGAAEAINYIVMATNQVSSSRGDLGAVQNRLDHTLNNLSVMTENIQDAESGIRDTDVADEMMAYTKNNILIQSAQAMLAQA